MSKIGSLAAVLFILSAAAAADAFSLRFLSADDTPVTHGESPSPTPGPSPVHPQLSPPPPALVPPPPSALVPPPPPPVDSGGPALVPPPPDGAAPGGEDLYKEAGCGEAAERCRVKEFVACLGHSADGSFLLVHNRGEDALNVNITTLIRVDPMLHLAKHGLEKISFSTNTTDVIKLVLNAGQGDCTLYIRPSISDWMYSQQFRDYASRLTPIHGAYILFVSMVITGGTWACCKFGRKSRRAGSGVPYQQLEMGTQVQTSSSVADTNTADGWEDNWDEGWDEEQAVVRPDESHPAVNVSSNGLTSRPPNKDGWDNDWDD